MKLSDAIKFTFKHRPSWRDGAGAATTKINIQVVKSVLGADFECDKATTGTFVLLQRALQQRKSKRGKPYSQSTINRITAAFHTVLHELKLHGKQKEVPAYRQLDESPPRERFYSKEEIDLMINTAKDLGDWELSQAIWFAFKTGCRREELVSLKVSEVNFEADELTFKDTKNGTDHVLPMTGEISSLLSRLCVGKDSTSPVFSSFLNGDQLLNRFKKVRDACGMDDDAVWHTFRHSCGTHLAEAGVPLHAIGGVLNHKSQATTQRYAKHSKTQKLNALEALAG